jgi:hypothetical protein
VIHGGFSNGLVLPLSNEIDGSFDAEDYFLARVNDRQLVAYEAPEYPQDSFWSNTLANLHFNGPLGEAVFVNTARLNVLTPATNVFRGISGANTAVLSNGQTKFGPTTYSSTGGGLFASNNAYTWGTGDVTVEGWSWWSVASSADLFDQRSAEPNLQVLIFVSNTGVFTYYVNGVNRITSSAGAVTTGNWFHWAWCRASSVSRLFLNGTQAGSNFADTFNFSASNVNVAAGFGDTSKWQGFHAAFRVTKAARYTTTFTPPTVFPDY